MDGMQTDGMQKANAMMNALRTCARKPGSRGGELLTQLRNFVTARSAGIQRVGYKGSKRCMTHDESSKNAKAKTGRSSHSIARRGIREKESVDETSELDVVVLRPAKTHAGCAWDGQNRCDIGGALGHRCAKSFLGGKHAVVLGADPTRGDSLIVYLLTHGAIPSVVSVERELASGDDADVEMIVDKKGSDCIDLAEMELEMRMYTPLHVTKEREKKEREKKEREKKEKESKESKSDGKQEVKPMMISGQLYESGEWRDANVEWNGKWRKARVANDKTNEGKWIVLWSAREISEGYGGEGEAVELGEVGVGTNANANTATDTKEENCTCTVCMCVVTSVVDHDEYVRVRMCADCDEAMKLRKKARIDEMQIDHCGVCWADEQEALAGAWVLQEEKTKSERRVVRTDESAREEMYDGGIVRRTYERTVTEEVTTMTVVVVERMRDERVEWALKNGKEMSAKSKARKRLIDGVYEDAAVARSEARCSALLCCGDCGGYVCLRCMAKHFALVTKYEVVPRMREMARGGYTGNLDDIGLWKCVVCREFYARIGCLEHFSSKADVSVPMVKADDKCALLEWQRWVTRNRIDGWDSDSDSDPGAPEGTVYLDGEDTTTKCRSTTTSSVANRT